MNLKPKAQAPCLRNKQSLSQPDEIVSFLIIYFV